VDQSGGLESPGISRRQSSPLAENHAEHKRLNGSVFLEVGADPVGDPLPDSIRSVCAAAKNLDQPRTAN
jgi:hypothetical protein